MMLLFHRLQNRNNNSGKVTTKKMIDDLVKMVFILLT